ncbi:universal stress protein [Sphingomonas sp. LaA6.9]|uniref:universal stress protein n=1 Tax=Sphingomonas sp. LaA6.9 TaxID=2919914 RepID=UPI001F4F5C1E|nr:universal stress protein [Sphingomonas sp. LaA6.9]MCJ8157025.1 universal stress protein [Sphingomonas sp. LaA6.9]
MKSILLDAHNDRWLAARVQAASILSKSVRARITALQTIEEPAMLASALLGAELRETELEDKLAPAQVAADISRECVQELFGSTKTVEWRRDIGDRGQRLMLHARLADLCVVSIDDMRDYGGLPDAMTRQSPCPILAVPTEFDPFDPHAPILVAWDGSFSASRALRAAVPVLRCSRAIKLVSIGHDPELPLSAAIDYLQREGVSASGDVLPESAPIAHVLVGAAAEHCSGLIVLGAAGHSALGRAFFGSVAQALLNRDAFPLFLAH